MPETNSRQPSIADYALLIGLAVMFGSSFLFTSFAVQTIPPLTVAAGRIVIAAVLIGVWLLVRAESLPKGTVWFWIYGSALFGNAVPFFLIAYGQQNVDTSLTAIFMAVMPLSTVLMAHVVTQDEKLNRWTFLGVCCGLIGVIVLMGWQALYQLGENAIPQLAILLAANCYAVNALITRKLTHLPKWSMSAGLLFAATSLVLPLALYFDKPWQIDASAESVGGVVFLAVGPTALATWLILIIIGRQSASFLSQINFIVPVVGVIIGTIVLHERLSPNAWIALVIILVGVAIARRGSRQTE